MKMAKIKIAVLVLLATLVFWSYYAYRVYCYYQDTTFEDPELGTYYINPDPFHLTAEGSRLLWLGVPLTGLCVVIPIFSLLKNSKRGQKENKKKE